MSMNDRTFAEQNIERIVYTEDGDLDEIVLTADVQVEKLDPPTWFIQVGGIFLYCEHLVMDYCDEEQGKVPPRDSSCLDKERISFTDEDELKVLIFSGDVHIEALDDMNWYVQIEGVRIFCRSMVIDQIRPQQGKVPQGMEKTMSYEELPDRLKLNEDDEKTVLEEEL